MIYAEYPGDVIVTPAGPGLDYWIVREDGSRADAGPGAGPATLAELTPEHREQIRQDGRAILIPAGPESPPASPRSPSFTARCMGRRCSGPADSPEVAS